MDVQQFVWIVGHGPVLVHKQFCVDIGRNSQYRLNNRPLSNDMYDAVREIYETCGIHYYQYTKWINQTMGNFMVLKLQSLFTEDACIVPVHNTYRVRGVYGENGLRYIDARMLVRIVDYDTVNTTRQIYVTCRRLLATEGYSIQICF